MLSPTAKNLADAMLKSIVLGILLLMLGYIVVR